MKKLYLWLGSLLAILLPTPAYAFNDGDGSGLLAIIIFIYGGPALVIIAIILIIAIIISKNKQTKKKLKYILAFLIGLFVFIEMFLIALATSGIDFFSLLLYNSIHLKS